MLSRCTGSATLPILLMVAASMPAAAADPRNGLAPERAADSRDKMICKRFVETGSLVRGYRTCKPKWEWERERDNLRQLGVSDSCRKEAEGGSCI